MKAFLGLFLFVLISSTVEARQSKEELKNYLSEVYKNQLSITEFPDSFYECGYFIFLYNKGRSAQQPEKTVGDECLFPLIENEIDKITFSDRGVKFLMAMKPIFIQGCSVQTNSPIAICKCAFDIYEEYQLGYLDMLEPDFEESEIKQKVNRECVIKSEDEN